VGEANCKEPHERVPLPLIVGLGGGDSIIYLETFNSVLVIHVNCTDALRDWESEESEIHYVVHV
jgi:hypothetical protein